MKKIVLLLMLVVAICTQATAQDVIVKKNGGTIVCRVKEVTSNSVIYQSWSNPSAPDQVISMSQVAKINYEKGQQDNVQQIEHNQYTPYSQNTGAGQYNDNALVAMYNVQQVPAMLKKANTYKWIGIIGGGTIIVGGVVAAILVKDNFRLTHGYTGAALFGTIAGMGAVAGGIFLWKSHQIKKKAEQINHYSLFENEFKFNGGTSLSAGIDVIKDNQFNTNTVGLGLRYNF